MKQHHFEIEHAEKYGVSEAIVINCFQYWIDLNRKNGRHQHDGRTWTYNSIKALNDTFSYWTPKQVRRVMESLEDKGVLITGNYNEKNYDKTKWYAFVNESEFLKPIAQKGKGSDKTHCPKGQNPLPKRANGIAQKGEPIPVNNQLITTVNISPKGESASAPRKKSTTKNQNEKRKKIAPKKEKEPALPFQLWEVWADRHERLHAETPTQDKKFFFHLKELSKKLAARIEAQGMEPTPESIANNFGMFLDMLIEKGDAWYRTNFTPDIFNSKFLNIIQLLKQQHNEERARADKYAAVIASFAN